MPASLWSFNHSIFVASLFLFGLTVFELICFKASSPPDRFWDFLSVYLPAGHAALHHDFGMLKTMIGKGVSGFVNMPVLAYLFAPLALLPANLAIAVFSAIGLALTIATWLLLARMAKLEPRERWLLALLFVVNGPLINGIKLGNTSYMILYALAAGLALLRAERPILAGALLGAAAMIKPPLLLFGVFFALRRDLRGVVGFAAVCIATSALSLILFGWSDNLYWFDAAILHYNNNWLAAFSAQSIPAFIYRLHGPSEVLVDWVSHSPGPFEKLIAQMVTGLLFLVAALACFKSTRQAATQYLSDRPIERRELQYLLTICLCLVASPLSWAHYYAWLLIPTAYFLGRRPPFPGPARVMGWVAILFVTPLIEWPWSIPNPVLMRAYSSFAVSHLLFGGLIWFSLVAWWLMQAEFIPLQANSTSKIASKPSGI